jgi:hypothetical protein
MRCGVGPRSVDRAAIGLHLDDRRGRRPTREAGSEQAFGGLDGIHRKRPGTHTAIVPGGLDTVVDRADYSSHDDFIE